MEYEYRVTQPSLRPGATSPIMGDRDVEEWLNEMSSNGWEFVSCGVQFWHDMLAQQFRYPDAKVVVNGAPEDATPLAICRAALLIVAEKEINNVETKR